VDDRRSEQDNGGASAPPLLKDKNGKEKT